MKKNSNTNRSARDNACWRAGVAAAAEIADIYNETTTHRHRLGDCIAFKLNARSAKPRINKERIVLDDMMVRGIVLGVAEMLRVCHDQTAAEHALRGAGVTKKVAEKAGCPKTDIDQIDWKRVHKKIRGRSRR